MLVEPEMLETKLFGDFYLADLLSEQVDVGDTVARIGRRPDRKSHVALID